MEFRLIVILYNQLTLVEYKLAIELPIKEFEEFIEIFEYIHLEWLRDVIYK